MKPAESASFLKSLLDRGYVEHAGVLYPPDQATARNIQATKPVTKKAKKVTKLYADSTDMFCQLVTQQLKVTIRMEYQFNPGRKWKFDYAIPDHKIAIESEGGIWRKGGGAHSRPANIIRDIEKYNSAASLGWTVIRRVTEKLLTEETLALIRISMTKSIT